MKNISIAIAAVYIMLGLTGCTSRFDEQKRVLREKDANMKTTEKVGDLEVTRERRHEVFGNTETTSASTSVTTRVK